MKQMSKMRRCQLALLLATIPFLVAAAVVRSRVADWSSDEVELLQSLSLERLSPPTPDPSNAFDGNPRAIELGERLFNDPRLSRNGAVSCASCHNPAMGFQDGRPVGQGVGTGRRRSMPIVDAAYSPWMFWDGRKDSLWSQALGPLEDENEHGGSRTQYVRHLATDYRAEYTALFGALPDLDQLPTTASPVGTQQARAAWNALDPTVKAGVNRAYANLGKAIAAYEHTLRHSETRFDRYVHAVARGDTDASAHLTPQELSGLRVFIGRGQCVSCHNGPLFTDESFHNTGVPARPGQAPDHGRRAALAQVVADEFNCLGPYSDAKPEQCGELSFLSNDDPALDGAFKTPGLRGVANRPPYMHAGQFSSLEEVIAHYQRAPRAPVGHSELASRPNRAGRAPIRLSAVDVENLTAFLRTLSSDSAIGRTSR
jgi:cytochrome c peroxidase